MSQQVALEFVLLSEYLSGNNKDYEQDQIPLFVKIPFDAGTAVGRLAQQLFPGGTELEYSSGISRNIELTGNLIAQGEKTIYEATFRYDNILAMVDILHRGREGWELYEVKSSTGTKDVFINDTAIQYYVVTGSGLEITRVFLVHLNNRYVRRGSLDLRELFTIADVTDLTLSRQAKIPSLLTGMRDALDGSEPDIDIGPYCTEPYECDFIPYCWQHIPECTVFDIANLRNERKFALYYGNILDLADIPPDFTLSGNMRIQVEAELTGKEFINTRNIREFLSTVSEPAGFLDFETFMEPVPSFDNQRPYQQIPFQYSLHIHEGGRLSHHEFLGWPETDPRRPLIEKLIADTEKCRSILVYNQSFEVSRLNEIARDLPEFATDIGTLLAKIADLMVPFKNRDYYVKEMCGSHSIKAVLPALVPEMNYEDLAIADGEMAMLAYSGLSTIRDAAEREKIRENLLAYCRLDTLAMVRIWQKLHDLTTPREQLSLF